MKNKNLLLGLILLAAALLRIVAFELRPPDAILYAPDEPDFYHIALSISSGEGFAFEGAPTAYRDMLYPSLVGILLRLSSEWTPIYFLLNLLADLLTVFLLFHIGAKRYGERIGLLVAALWALYPAAILFSTLFMTETLFVCFITLALFVYDRLEENWNSFPSALAGGSGGVISSLLLGIVLGAATLTRAVGLLFCAAYLVYIVLIRYETPRGIRFRSAAIMLAGFIITVLPWMIRNQIVMNTFSLNTNGGINLYIGNNPYATGGYRFDAPVADSLETPPAPPHNTLSPHSVGGPRGEILRDQLGASFAVNFWKTHRAEAIDLWPRKFAHLWTTDMQLWLHYDPFISPSALASETSPPRFSGVTGGVREKLHALPLWKLALLALPFMLIVTFGAAGISLSKHFPTRGLFILQLTFTAFAAFISYGIFRYHFPVMPALIISSVSLIRPAPWKSAPQWRRLYLLLFAGMFAGIWTYEVLTIAGW